MRVRIRDFQSLKEVELLVEGITILTGDNNVGKSAVLRAILATMYGRMGDDHVRKGAKKAMVGLELPADPDNDETALVWIKGKGGAQYYLDGVECERMGRIGVPADELLKRGIRKVDYVGGSQILIYWDQEEPPFLVSMIPTHAFDLVSRILQERKVLPVLKQMSKDLKDLRDQAVNLEGQIQARAEDIKSLSDTLILAEQVLPLEPKVALVSTLSSETVHLTGLIQAVSQAVSVYQQHADTYNRMETREATLVAATSRLATVLPYFQFQTSAQQAQNEVNRLTQEHQKLEMQVSVLPRVDVASRLITESVQLYKAIESMKGQSRLVDVEKQRFDVVATAHDTLSRVDPEALSLKVQEIKTLKAALGSIQWHKDKTDELAYQDYECDNRLFVLTQDYENARKELKVCPLCGSDLTGGTCGSQHGGSTSQGSPEGNRADEAPEGTVQDPA